MNAQFKKGVLDLVLLHLVHERPVSVYDILIRLRSALDVNENTIYPLLRRLEKEGHLRHVKRAGEMGAPKKIFGLTPSGTEHYRSLYEQWETFKNEVSSLLGGQ